jgi:hypothetical protein
MVSKPLFSVSAICHISPSMAGASLVRSKNLTAISPVMTPSFSVSAALKRYWKMRFSSGVRLRMGWPGEVSRQLQGVDELEGTVF